MTTCTSSVEQIVDKVLELPERQRLQILAPVIRKKKGQHKSVVEKVICDVAQVTFYLFLELIKLVRYLCNVTDNLFNIDNKLMLFDLTNFYFELIKLVRYLV